METKKTQEELKEYGQVMAVARLVFCFICYLKQSVWAVFFVGLALIFYSLAVLAPSVLRLPEKYWMAMAERISVVVTFILTTLIFYLLVTPTGLIFRLLGKRPIELGFDPEAKTYWVPIKADGPASRPSTPY